MKYLLLIGGLLAGCMHQKATNIEVIWHDSECLFVANGLSIEQAKELQQTWKFEQCKIQVNEN